MAFLLQHMNFGNRLAKKEGLRNDCSVAPYVPKRFFHETFDTVPACGRQAFDTDILLTLWFVGIDTVGNLLHFQPIFVGKIIQDKPSNKYP